MYSILGFSFTLRFRYKGKVKSKILWLSSKRDVEGRFNVRNNSIFLE